MFKDFAPAHSHQATRKELNEKLGPGWIGFVDFARALHIKRELLTALIQRGVIGQGMRLGAYRAWSADEYDNALHRLEDLQRRAATAYPIRRSNGKVECPACKKIGTGVAALIRHLSSCPDLLAGLARAEEFGETWRTEKRGLKTGFYGLSMPKKSPSNFVQVLGPLGKSTLTVGKPGKGNTQAWTWTAGGNGMQQGTETITKAEKADLVYALCQLVETGKVPIAEVGALIAARTARIKVLETELKRLKSEGIAGGQFWKVNIDPVVVPPAVNTVKPLATAPNAFDPSLRHLRNWRAAGGGTVQCQVGPKKAMTKRAKFDPKVSGRFNALVQHRCKTASARKFWYDLARKIGAAAALVKFEKIAKWYPENKTAPKAAITLPAKPLTSPARKAFLRQQGLYLGHIRHVKNPAQRNRIKAIAKEQGIPAAVQVLLKLRKGT